MNKKMALWIISVVSMLCAITGCVNITAEPDDCSNTTVKWESTDLYENVTTEYSDNETSADNNSNDELAELTIHYIDVGQGDCTLIVCKNQAMLIDAGDNSKGTLVQNYLMKQGISTLDYVIGTHPDADHIGGLDVVLYKFDCKTIIMPDEKKDTATYRDVVDTMKNKGYKNTLPVVGATYKLGDATFTIVSPSKHYSDSNNNSVSILLTHGDNKFLFTGDAEEKAESEMLNNGIALKADVLKAGHHGSSTASTLEFLEEVSPEYVVISCGENNSYGHPHAEVMNNIRALGIKVFRTDEQGTIQVTSNGRDIYWNCSPSETWKAGEPTGR